MNIEKERRHVLRLMTFWCVICWGFCAIVGIVLFDKWYLLLFVIGSLAGWALGTLMPDILEGGLK